MPTLQVSHWQYATTTLNSAPDPEAALVQLGAADWHPVAVPGAVAGSVEGDIDAWNTDWWFRTTLVAERATSARSLRFDGVATLATVWVNGIKAAENNTMFAGFDAELPMEAGTYEVVVVCRGLASIEPPAKPRQRWRTQLVPDARLRWIRTSLWGHMSGWTPPVPAVGIVRSVTLRCKDAATTLRDGFHHHSDSDGLHWSIDARFTAEQAVTAATLSIGDRTSALEIAADGTQLRISGSGATGDLERWWPHTHGAPTLHQVTVTLEGLGSANRFRLAAVGHRSVDVDTTDDGFQLHVNDVAVFARGACWTPVDPRRLWSDPADLARALAQVRDAGLNMVRILGVAVPEQREFYDLCDELGIMVWHDLPYANFDYPFDDAGFAEMAKRELDAFVSDAARHASTTVICGGSEVHQQAAMFGLSSERREISFLEQHVPAALLAGGCSVPYVPSSPWGGALPFDVNVGVSHYYGVGAYRRPLDDVRRSDVRFTSECLAFSIVPSAESNTVMPDEPGWAAGVPRDRGADWDFETVRDHYVRELSGEEPDDVRVDDPHRWLELGRAAVAEAVDAALREMRSSPRCGGALVYLLRDNQPGAGWGYVDFSGRPKAPWFVLARHSAPRAVLFTDEGLNGLALHVVNDSADSFIGRVEVAVHGQSGQVLAEAAIDVAVEGHSARRDSVNSVLDGFRDLTYAYRFGTLDHAAVSAKLVVHGAGGDIAVGHDVWSPHHRLDGVSDPSLWVRAERSGDRVDVEVGSQSFAPWVHFEAPGYVADDDWFHLPGGGSRSVTLRPFHASTRSALDHAGISSGNVGSVRCLASSSALAIAIADTTP